MKKSLNSPLLAVGISLAVKLALVTPLASSLPTISLLYFLSAPAVLSKLPDSLTALSATLSSFPMLAAAFSTLFTFSSAPAAFYATLTVNLALLFASP
ncbi:hypothetical protein ACJDT4_19185 [Clostridium neuense]|uniref:Uncharacterized protein n=1 Tax=Clostridium neuense TaxID=1728934 RepID=A0ABW8TJP0_9CLOT